MRTLTDNFVLRPYKSTSHVVEMVVPPWKQFASILRADIFFNSGIAELHMA